MKPSEIVRNLTAAGVRLWVEGDRLHFDPKDKVTPEIRASLRASKAALLAYLQEQARRAEMVARWERDQHTSTSAKSALEMWRRMDAIEAGFDKVARRYYHSRQGELTALDARWRKGLEADRRGYQDNGQREKAFRLFGEIVAKAAPILEELTDERPDLLSGLTLALLDPGLESNGKEAA